ncbi:MAG: phospholipase D-like domain-containing protein, partial [Planctomycetota bacterium]
GSWNVSASDQNERLGPRYDVMMRGVGPMALQVQMLFLTDWAFEGDSPRNETDLFPDMQPAGEDIAQIVPSDPLVESAPVRDTAQFLINHSRERVVLVTPYFIPDEPVELALCMAARRGVEVNVVVPASSDLRFVDAATRSYCRVCAKAGVQTHFFTPGFLHAKVLLVDGVIAMVGSANFDNRSFRLNLETNVVVYSPSVINYVRKIQEYYIRHSVGMRKAHVSRSHHRRLGEDLARLVSPLL